MGKILQIKHFVISRLPNGKCYIEAQVFDSVVQLVEHNEKKNQRTALEGSAREIDQNKKYSRFASGADKGSGPSMLGG